MNNLFFKDQCMKYGEIYFKSGNYKNYLKRYNRYKILSKEIKSFILEPVLDFGCGVGFLVSALNEIDIEAYGYDLSDWAINYGIDNLNLKPNSITKDWNNCIKKCGTLFALDVFEHMSIEQVKNVLNEVEAKILITRIPVTIKKGENFLLEESKKDFTHINCLEKEEWEIIFQECGFNFISLLKFDSIWDSQGVLSRVYEKNNCWTR